MSTSFSVSKCPHCGKRLPQMFESTQPTMEYDPVAVSVFSEAVNFATQFGVITGGSLLVLWLSNMPAYWLAPTAGLVGSVGLVLWNNRQAPPPASPGKLNLKIDVSQKETRLHKKTILDAFEGCRPMQLWKAANAHLNHNVDFTRRAMKKHGVSQGQFETIRDRLVSRGWADLQGDYDNAVAVPNRAGKAILREILRAFPTPPGSSG